MFNLGYAVVLAKVRRLLKDGGPVVNFNFAPGHPVWTDISELFPVEVRDDVSVVDVTFVDEAIVGFASDAVTLGERRHHCEDRTQCFCRVDHDYQLWCWQD